MSRISEFSVVLAAHPRIVMAVMLLTLLALAVAAAAPDGFPCGSLPGC